VLYLQAAASAKSAPAPFVAYVPGAADDDEEEDEDAQVQRILAEAQDHARLEAAAEAATPPAAPKKK
jgi:hypothetical protein